MVLYLRLEKRPSEGRIFGRRQYLRRTLDSVKTKKPGVAWSGTTIDP